MKGDLHPIAFKLSQELPKRVHVAHEPEERKYVKLPPEPIPQNAARPIRFRGKTYASMKEAKRLLHCRFESLQRWLDTGDAEYV